MNIRQVILAERWCVENGLHVTVIPVPWPFSTACGMCLEIKRAEGDTLEKFAKESGFTATRILISNFRDGDK